MERPIYPAVLTCAIVGSVVACSPSQFTTVAIYDSPDKYVHLEFDRAVQRGKEHSHPVSLSPEQLAAVLGGVRIVEPLPLVRGDITDIVGESEPRVHPAFSDKEIAFFAPLLSLALSRATPEEVATFYESRKISAIVREVTSGGLFVRGDELHLILANNRSHTHYMADLGVAETKDDRLTPMQSLAPQEGRIDFEPSSAKRNRSIGIWEKLFQWDHRVVVVLYKQLAPRPLVKLDSP